MTPTVSRFVIAVTFCFCVGWHAAAQVPSAWSVRDIGLGGSGYDEANAIALDRVGNVYVTGQRGLRASGPDCCVGDFWTIKYKSGAVQWRAAYNGPASGHDVASSLVVDRLGNVYVAGSSAGTINGASTGQDIAIVKYTANGQLLWESRYHLLGDDSISKNSLAVDRAGNVYATGESWGGNSFDIVTMKVDGDDGTRLWAVRYSGSSATSNDRGKALSLDAFGNVYVTGRSTGTDGLADFVTIKYNPKGEQQWLARYNGGTSSVDFPNALALDRSGNVVVTGESHGNILSTDVLRSSCKGDFATVKYSPSGQQIWAAKYNGAANCDDYAPVIAVDRFYGNVYISGITRTSQAGTDWATVKYAANGSELWVQTHRGADDAVNRNDSPCDIELDLYGAVYVAGTTGGSTTDFDFTTVKYNSSGLKQWESRQHGGGREGANALAVDRARDIFVTGWSYVGSSDLDYLTIKATVHSTEPVARFDWSPAQPIEGQAVQFTDQSTAPLTWAWDFNNDARTDSTSRNPTHTFADPGAYEVTLRVTNDLGAQSITETVVVESTENVPYVRSVVRQYPGFFLHGVSVENKFDAGIDWKGEAGSAAFQVESGAPQIEVGNSSGASHTFAMATDFQPAFSGSVVTVTPTNAAGTTGIPRDETVYVFPLPSWLAVAWASDSEVLKFTASGGEIKAEMKKNFPDEPISKEFVIPESIPYVGGPFGVSAGASFSGEVSSTGVGSLSLGGKMGFKALGQPLEGSVDGSGTFRLLPPEGLVLQTASFTLGIKGTLSKEQGLVEAIPQLAALQAVPVIGGVVSWVNDRAKLKGEISPSVKFTANFEQQDGSLAFKEGPGTLGCDLKATLEVSLVEDVIECKAWVGGGGNFTLGLPATVAAPLLRSGELKFEAGAEITFSALLEYAAKATYQAKCTWTPASGVTCESAGSADSAGSVSSLMLHDGEVRPIVSDASRFGPESSFAPRTIVSSGGPAVPLSTTTTALITNVFKGASPHLLEVPGAKQLLLFVTKDAADPVLQSTDVAWSLFDGSSWSVPVVVADDTRVELAPDAAVDANGKVVAAWTRIRDAAFSSPVAQASELPSFYSRLEVVTAVFDPGTGTWSSITPLTDDTAFDSNVTISDDGEGNLLLTWLSNPAGHFLSTSGSPSSLRYSIWNGSVWSAPGTVASGLVGVHSHTAARHGSNAFVILPRDPDPSTANDGVLDLYSWNGSSWSTATPFAAGGIENRLPRAVYDAGGAAHVVWMRGSDLVHATLDAPAPRVIRSASESLSFYDGMLMINTAGNLTYLRQESVDNGPANIVATIYDTASNSWSKDRRLTDNAGKDHDVSAYYGTDGRLHVAHVTTAVTRTTITATIGGAGVTIGNIPEDGPSDLRIVEHTLSTDLATADQELDIVPRYPRKLDPVTATLVIHNAGDVATGTFFVRIYVGDPGEGGIEAGSAEIVGPFLAGDRRKLTFPFVYPAMSGSADIVAVVDATAAVAELSETNNTAVARLASNTAPEARIVPSVTSGAVPLTITFDGSRSFDTDGDPIAYNWSFGDGSQSETGASITHTFTSEGIFSVVLAVRDAHGLVGTTTVEVQVAPVVAVVRGDANGDGLITPSDVFHLINHLFAGGPAPADLRAGDANSDEAISVGDLFFLINYLFAGGPVPAP